MSKSTGTDPNTATQAPLLRLIAFGFSLGPILFGIGFIAPLVAALFALAGVAKPLGIPPIYWGLIIGIGLGAMARMRKTWLW